MVRIFVYCLLWVLFLSPNTLLAGSHDVVKQTFVVNGVCEQCKKRIEEAAYVKGVKYADWNVETHDLTVRYDSSKTKPEIILQNIANKGHDNQMFKAPDNDYNKLPSCCRYKSGIKKH